MKHELLSAQALVHVGAGEEFVTRGIPAYLIPRSVASNLGFSFLDLGFASKGPGESSFSHSKRTSAGQTVFLLEEGILMQDCVK